MTEVKKTQPVELAVLTKINEFQKLGQLSLPDGYNPGNALKSAALLLPSIDGIGSCSGPSIVNALMEMAIQGLEPVKHQCSFIKRGDKLTLQREYAGSIALARREGGLIGIPKAYTIYKGDVLEYDVDLETGLQKITNYVPKRENIKPENIEGAVVIARFNEGTDSLYMSIEQIKKAWLQGSAKGNSSAHKNFPDQMCEKTAINRLLKRYINSSSDNSEVIASKAPLNEQEAEEVEEIEVIDLDEEATIIEATEEKPEF